VELERVHLGPLPALATGTRDRFDSREVPEATRRSTLGAQRFTATVPGFLA
jgi:hypothetical protein